MGQALDAAGAERAAVVVDADGAAVSLGGPVEFEYQRQSRSSVRASIREVTGWEARNHADGILRARNVPVKWTVTDNGTADYTEAAITLTWGDRTTTKLVVDMTRRSHKIIHIGDKGIGGK